MSPLIPITRTTYLQLFVKKIPDLILYGTVVTGVLYWPHAFIQFFNWRDNVPNINSHTYIGYDSVYDINIYSVD